MQKFSRTSGELHESRFHGTFADFYRGQGTAQVAGWSAGINGMVLELLYNLSLDCPLKHNLLRVPSQIVWTRIFE